MTPSEVKAVKHGMNCPQRTMGSEDSCTCGLEYRIQLQTEIEMHKAWRKRAEEAEAKHDEKIIEDRDAAHRMLDNFMDAVGGIAVCGEHSNLNDPWDRALDEVNVWRQSIQDAISELAFVEKRAEQAGVIGQPTGNAGNAITALNILRAAIRQAEIGKQRSECTCGRNHVDDDEHRPTCGGPLSATPAPSPNAADEAEVGRLAKVASDAFRFYAGDGPKVWWYVARSVRDAVIAAQRPKAVDVEEAAKVACVEWGKPYPDAALPWDEAAEELRDTYRRQARAVIRLCGCTVAEKGEDRVDPEELREWADLAERGDVELNPAERKLLRDAAAEIERLRGEGE